MATSKVQISPVGQYTITIPAALAKAKNLKKGDLATWKINSKGELEVKI